MLLITSFQHCSNDLGFLYHVLPFIPKQVLEHFLKPLHIFPYSSNLKQGCVSSHRIIKKVGGRSQLDLDFTPWTMWCKPGNVLWDTNKRWKQYMTLLCFKRGEAVITHRNEHSMAGKERIFKTLLLKTQHTYQISNWHLPESFIYTSN